MDAPASPKSLKESFAQDYFVCLGQVSGSHLTDRNDFLSMPVAKKGWVFSGIRDKATSRTWVLWAGLNQRDQNHFLKGKSHSRTEMGMDTVDSIDFPRNVLQSSDEPLTFSLALPLGSVKTYGLYPDPKPRFLSLYQVTLPKRASGPGH